MENQERNKLIIMSEIENVVMIGSGNVATHLALAFSQRNKKIKQVVSKNEENASSLANHFKCTYSNDISKIFPGADLYVIAVSDSIIPEITKKFPYKNAFVVHTSGSMPMDVLKETGDNYGVLYPLQTFTKNVKLDINNIPFCIEANTEKNLNILNNLAKELSTAVYETSSTQRETLHLAAVFACNFTNHLYHIASDLLEKDGLPYDMLKPLISETARKAGLFHPKHAQTGPAVRNDTSILNKHIEKLNMFDDYKKIYTFMSQSIKKNKNK